MTATLGTLGTRRRWWFTPERTWSLNPDRAWVAPGWRLRNEARRMRGVPMEVQHTQEEQ
jgi:hypothetical protein